MTTWSWAYEDINLESSGKRLVGLKEFGVYKHEASLTHCQNSENKTAHVAKGHET